MHRKYSWKNMKWIWTASESWNEISMILPVKPELSETRVARLLCIDYLWHFFINHMYSCFQGCCKLICAIFLLFCNKKQTLWTSEIWCRFKTYMYACKHVSTWLVNFPREGPGWIGSPWNTWSTFEVRHISNTSQVQEISSTPSTTYLKYSSSTANLKYISSTTEISSISQKYNTYLKYISKAQQFPSTS